MTRSDCCILNSGAGAWAFEEHASRLRRALWVDASDAPRAFNYVLGLDEDATFDWSRSFIPQQAVRLASDKRLLARTFADAGVPTPRTHLAEHPRQVVDLLRQETDHEWCLKWPTGCGAAGHRLLAAPELVPEDWPRPYVVQEFVRLPRPEVYRIYAAGGATFGWNVRRYPPDRFAAGAAPSPWVAHARGARYGRAGEAPAEAVAAARLALEAVGLVSSFGCADLLCRPAGEWVVLEVGTDGVYNHVDRDFDDPALAEELNRGLAVAFWSRAGDPPWGSGVWRPLPD